MSEQLKLRDYQRECIDAVLQSWYDGVKRPAVVLPTGAGKTVVFAHLIKEFLRESTYHAKRVIVLVHRDELADQAMAKIRSIAPELSVGKVKARELDYGRDVVVCSVQTLVSSRGASHMKYMSDYGPIGLIITDECHHAAAVSYQKVYDAFPDALQLGVTATMARGDRVGLGSVWEEVVYTRSILWMISKGYLTDVKAHRIKVTDLDLNDVGRSRGDYRVDDLGKALIESGAIAAVPKAYLDHASDRQGVIFTPTVAAADEAARELNTAGVRTAVVSGETPREERQQIYDDFRTGKVQVLSNCMVLTEGWDAPWASCAVIARPTQSAPLYTQMVGRVLRPYPGKKDALVLDLVGSSSLKLRTLIDLEPGAVHETLEGETLADAVVREAEAANQKVPAGSIAFELRHRDVDMFAGSDVAWHRTPGGVLFIDCGPDERKKQRRTFLWPGDAGLWDVCWQVDGAKFECTSHTGLDLGSAMAWGEVVAEDRGAFNVRRSASWRKGKPSEAQLSYAEGLGIDTTGMGKGDVSEAIGVARAARVFDRFVK